MKIIGWIGSIILAPFYFLFTFQEKIRLAFWPMIAYILFCIWAVFIYAGGNLNKETFDSGWGDIAESIFGLIVLLIIMSIVGGILSYVTLFLNIVLSGIGFPFIKAFTYTNAWRQGISKDELEGRLEYIRMQKEAQKLAAEAKKRQRKEDAFNKGFQDQARKSNAQNTYTSQSSAGSGNDSGQSSGTYTNNNYSNTGEGYQKSNQSQSNSRSNASSDYYTALNLFMLDEGYTLEELKKQRNRLLKSFHPDEGSEETKKYAQKINGAYEILKRKISK